MRAPTGQRLVGAVLGQAGQGHARVRCCAAPFSPRRRRSPRAAQRPNGPSVHSCIRYVASGAALSHACQATGATTHAAPSCTASIAAARQARWLAGETPAPRAIGCRPQRGGRAQRLCTGLFLANAARKRPAREGVLLGLWPAQHSHARCDTPEILRRAANVNPAGVSLQCLSAVRRVAAGQGGPQQSSHA